MRIPVVAGAQISAGKMIEEAERYLQGLRRKITTKGTWYSMHKWMEREVKEIFEREKDVWDFKVIQSMLADIGAKSIDVWNFKDGAIIKVNLATKQIVLPSRPPQRGWILFNKFIRYHERIHLEHNIRSEIFTQYKVFEKLEEALRDPLYRETPLGLHAAVFLDIYLRALRRIRLYGEGKKRVLRIDPLAALIYGIIPALLRARKLEYSPRNVMKILKELERTLARRNLLLYLYFSDAIRVLKENLKQVTTN